MRQILEFLKSTALGGAFVVLPLILTLFLVQKAVSVLEDALSPLAASLPPNLMGKNAAMVVSLILLLAASFLIGLVVRTRLGAGLGRWFEEKLLFRIPGYKLMRLLSGQLSGTVDENQFAPAVIRRGPDTLVLAYIIEQHDTGYFTVLVPDAPSAMTGTLQYVPADRVTRLNVPLGRVFGCLGNYGIGAGEFFVPHTPSVLSG